MSYTTTIIEQFLSLVPLFNQLPPDAISDLTEKIQPLRYRMGQVMLMREKMQSHVSILCEGQARLLGYDPRTKMPITLKLINPGEIIGWVNLVRGVACETIMASTEVVCLTLSNEDFLELLEKYPQLKQEFKDKLSVVEVFELVGSQVEKQARADLNLKDVTLKCLNEGELHYLPPGKHKLGTALTHSLEDRERLWLVSGGSIADFPIGSRLRFEEDIQYLEVQGEKPARLVGFTMSKWLEDSTTTTRGRYSSEADLDSQLQELGDREPLRLENVPYAKADDILNSGSITTSKKEKESRKDYPFIHGRTPLEAGVACFQMLSKYYKMPFRKEVIQRVLSEQLQRTDNLSLPLCGAISELMGLNAQLVTVPAEAFTRLKPPFLVRWQDSLAIVYEASDRNLVIAVPELGLLRRKPEEFFQTWEDEGQVLLLQTTRETPQERFGLSWFIPSVIQYKRVLIEVFVASFFVQLFALANPLMIQIIIDKVISQNSADTLGYLIVFLIVISVFEAMLTTLRTYLFVDTTNRIDMALGSEIIDHLLRLPLRYFERRPVGEISTRINELEKIRQFLTGTALTVVLDTLFSVVYIVVMVFYSWVLTLVALGIIPVFVGLTLIFSPTIRKELRVKAERNSETQSYLVEIMTGIQTVKAQNIELRARWQWQERYARYITAGFKTVITSTLASSASSFLNKLSAALIIGVGAYLVLDQQLSLGQLIAFRIISGYVTSPIMRLAQLWQNFQETALSLERLADIVDHPEEAEQDRDNIPMPAISGKVKYENICFRFKTSGPLQLNNVSLEFEPGTFVALVGESGAGKSTVTKLLSRLYEPEGGRILIDGYDISKVELYSLRRQVGVVPQETLLFDGTIQENIALTNPDATTEEIIAAAQIAAAHEFIMTLPNGYNTRAGERGSALSGGQRQRIAIARSVLQQPAMLVLDEATSALDYATEHEVSRNLKEAFHDRTVFFITHRLGTIKNADVIVLMGSGSVIEQGTHEELMALRGRYYYLYQQQESSV
ncbi:MAG: peptidase domain-containing ABC transporter [Xenococcaceae cyanobacterium]